MKIVHKNYQSRLWIKIINILNQEYKWRSPINKITNQDYETTLSRLSI
jgi:hypothetical protein